MLDFIKQNKNIYKAFTLAEVLITLLIIGVIASIVVPNLINDSKDAELKTSWKKQYSNISQAFQRILIDNGGTLKGVCPSVGWHEDSKCIMNTFKQYLNLNKFCLETYGTENICWHAYSPPSVQGLDGSDIIFWSNNYPALILNDGALLSFQGGTSECITNAYGAINQCIFIVIDVNGFKGPDVVGKDIFGIHVFDKKNTPFGYNDTLENDCNTNPPSGVGAGCAAKYLYQ